MIFRKHKKKPLPKENKRETSIKEENWAETITEDKIRELFVNCEDVKIQKLHLGTPPYLQPLLLIYCEGLSDVKQINQVILPKLEEMFTQSEISNKEDFSYKKWLNISLIKLDQGSETIVSEVFKGNLILYFETLNSFYSADIADPPHRNPEESSTEMAIRGSRDDFIEVLANNVALIRRRLQTDSLCYETFIVGRRSHTKIGLLYIKDIINMEYVDEVKRRLAKLDVDSITSSSQLESGLSKGYSFPIFPIFDYTGRPDYAVECLLNGRFILITDGSPTVSIAPANLSLLLKSPEDQHFTFLYVSFARLLRMVGLITALFLPPFYLSLTTYHQDQIPFPLLATITNARLGIPLSAPVEMLLILGLYELFREAGIRLPKVVGQTLTVVGGLIIGDAAIRAGLASASIVVVASITAVTRYTLVNQHLGTVVGVVSLFSLFCSMFLGMFGFLISVFAILLYLANLDSFGVSYLAPLSPPTPQRILHAFIMYPFEKWNRRPKMLKPQDSTRQGERK